MAGEMATWGSQHSSADECSLTYAAGRLVAHIAAHVSSVDDSADTLLASSGEVTRGSRHIAAVDRWQWTTVRTW